MTDQQKALKRAHNLYGNSAFTEHTVNYVRVGFKREKKTYMAIGNTWGEAFKILEASLLDET